MKYFFSAIVTFLIIITSIQSQTLDKEFLQENLQGEWKYKNAIMKIPDLGDSKIDSWPKKIVSFGEDMNFSITTFLSDGELWINSGKWDLNENGKMVFTDLKSFPAKYAPKVDDFEVKSVSDNELVISYQADTISKKVYNTDGEITTSSEDVGKREVIATYVKKQNE